MKLSVFILQCLFWGLIQAKGKGSPPNLYPDTEIAVQACTSVASALGTWCNTEQDARDCYCSNIDSLATVIGCIQFYYEVDKTIEKSIINLCSYAAPLNSTTIQEAMELYKTQARNTTSIPGFNKTIPINFPILVSPQFAALYKASVGLKLGNYRDSLYFGTALVGYWALVLLLATIINWGKYLFPQLVDTTVNRYTVFFKKHVTAPAIHRSKTNLRRFAGFASLLVPSRLETLIVSVFAGLCIAFMAINIRYIEGDPMNPKRGEGITNLLATRTGILSSCLMPLLILFAGRNNFLLFFTRWNFATFVTYHRWIARLIVSMIIIHASCYTIDLCLDKYYTQIMKRTYMRWGIVGAVSGSFILIQGMHFLRTRWYEVFLLLHILLAVLFIAAAWIHTEDSGYVYFYYAASAVWVFDRVVRIGRLISFGCPKSEVILLADETLKVIVPRPKYWKPVPGGHAFVHFMRPSCFWQSHPFTFTKAPDLADNIVLYCKVKGGVTHGLYQYLVNHPGRTAQIRVSVEGPYGEASDSKHFKSAVFVAGGNGIPGIYSEVVDLAQRTKDKAGQVLKLIWIIREYKSLYWFYEELLALKRTKIVPIIYVTSPRSDSCIYEFDSRIPKVQHDHGLVLEKSSSQSVQDDEAKVGKNLEMVEIGSKSSSTETEEKKVVYQEKVFEEYDDDSKQRENIVASIHSELCHVEFREGRPNIEGFVKEEIQESEGSTAFVTCGHPAMVDELRHCVAQNLDLGNGHRVEFFEKLQVWA